MNDNEMGRFDCLQLLGMSFSACHGCLPEEKILPQPFVVDTFLFLPLKKAGETDDIVATVDYTAVFALTKAIINGETVKLIETLAERIAAAVLLKFPAVKKVRVTVHKPESPLVGQLSDVAATIERSQEDYA